MQLRMHLWLAQPLIRLAGYWGHKEEPRNRGIEELRNWGIEELRNWGIKGLRIGIGIGSAFISPPFMIDCNIGDRMSSFAWKWKVNGAIFMYGKLTGCKDKYVTTTSENPSHTHVSPHLAYLSYARKHSRCTLGGGGKETKIRHHSHIANGLC